MAAVGVEVGVSWFPTSGVVGFFIALLLLSIFLTSLCSMCRRRSFHLKDSEADKDPSALIKVAKLEETVEMRENPMINEELKDETDGQTNPIEEVKDTAIPSKTAEESKPEGENAAKYILWRSHLNQDGDSSTAPDNIFQTIDVNSMYAQVNQKERLAALPPYTPREVLVEEEVSGGTERMEDVKQ
ncbi:uncharacterized protein LOC117744500 isoform X2 [Cyclopterus lumpus]|nr:uncharacterized protein LOC117744500 isoform X2 [Cyclopterus lumpus]XP_034408732.1 uncharacterized protein LOC117744500 isoform X2 [Cyclopterus lumpus]